MLVKILLWGVICYFLYKFIFNLVIPVSKAASQMKEKIREMQQAEQAPYTQQNFQARDHSKPTPTSENDYIDFEEVK